MNSKKERKGFSKKTKVTLISKKLVNSKNEKFLKMESTQYLTDPINPTVFFNICFDKNHLKTLIAWFLEKYGQKNTITLVETLKHIGFHQATSAGVSLGVDDLQIPPQKPTLLYQASLKISEANSSIQTGNVTNVEKSQALIDTWNQTSETLRQTAVQNFRTTNPVNPVYMMAFSGARGNISQVRQLVAMRGLMADPQGAILEFPIQSNFREGLTVTEYLISCFGARKGLVDTALRTATSGYLTRRLVDAVQHVVVHVTDCYTKKGILIKDKHLEQRLIGRVLLKDLVLNSDKVIKKNTLICPRLAKQILLHHKEILVRSPLTCETEKSVCQFCYGMDLAQGKLVSLGEAVGIIAAQSIGEPGTQLTMRTFHTGGVGVFSEQSMTSFIAPFSGKIKFLEPLCGLFVRTPHGKIVYLVKQKKKNKKIHEYSVFNQEMSSDEMRETKYSALSIEDDRKIAVRLVSTKDPTNIYEIKLNDIPPGSLLWVREGEIVKSGQLIVQASRLETAKKEMPESIHPVYTPISGEVFFESVKLRKIEDQQSNFSKLKKQKLAEPIIPTLAKLGNFWIFSSFIQKETHVSQSFFRKGDLLSRETPIQQYNLHIPLKGQLKKLDSNIIFGTQPIELDFSKIDYSTGSYFFLNTVFFQKCFNKKFRLPKTTLFSSLSEKACFSDQSLFGNAKNLRQRDVPNFLIYTRNSDSTILHFYPFFRKSFLKFNSLVTNCYCTCLDLGTFSLSTFQTRNMFGTPLPLKIGGGNNHSVICTPHSILTLKNFSVLHSNSKDSNILFLVNTNSKILSQTGIFHIANNHRIVWSSKIKLLKTFQKNCFTLEKQSLSKKENIFSFRFDNLMEFENTNNGRQRCDKVKIPSSFVKKGLTLTHKSLYKSNEKPFIHKPQSWFYLPKKSFSKHIRSKLAGTLLKPGICFENILFSNVYVSLNFINTDTLRIVKIKKESVNANQSGDFLKSANQNINSQFLNKFCFYKKRNFSKEKNQKIFEGKLIKFFPKFHSLGFELKDKKQISYFLFFQKAHHELFLYKNLNNFSLDKFLKQPIFSLLGKSDFHSPVFTKQKSTVFGLTQSSSNRQIKQKIVSPASSGWVSSLEFLKIEFELIPPKQYHKIDLFSRNKEINLQNQISLPTLKIQVGQKIKLQNVEDFHFQTFENNWIVPSFPITKAFLKSKKLGEFLQLQMKNNSNYLNILRTHDLITLNLPIEKSQFCKGNVSNNNLNIGTRLRWGQELIPGFGNLLNGQIIKKTGTKLTLRKGIPLLASTNGLVHIKHNDLIEKKDLLITLRSRRLQTEDIVQGIPKIEQLFEARETQGGEILQGNMHIRLRTFFYRALRIRPLPQAVDMSILFIQKFLVNEILQAYSNQGVQIAEKHVEVVVRQMTARVRILTGGGTGLLPGELIQHRVIEKINHQLKKVGQTQATYEPVILGITKSVLQSESFLLAASFQQVSKVLVRSALANKTDFLRGLHENILVGQPIPAGTGIILKPNPSIQSLENSSIYESPHHID